MRSLGLALLLVTPAIAGCLAGLDPSAPSKDEPQGTDDGGDDEAKDGDAPEPEPRRDARVTVHLGNKSYTREADHPEFEPLADAILAATASLGNRSGTHTPDPGFHNRTETAGLFLDARLRSQHGLDAYTEGNQSHPITYAEVVLAHLDEPERAPYVRLCSREAGTCGVYDTAANVDELDRLARSLGPQLIHYEVNTTELRERMQAQGYLEVPVPGGTVNLTGELREQIVRHCSGGGSSAGNGSGDGSGNASGNRSCTNETIWRLDGHIQGIEDSGAQLSFDEPALSGLVFTPEEVMVFRPKQAGDGWVQEVSADLRTGERVPG